MIPRDSAPTIEFVNGFYWYEEGVLHIRPKNYDRNLKAIKEGFEFIQNLNQGRRVCVVFHNENLKPMDPEARAYANEQFPRMFKAIAIVGTSAIARITANLIFTVVNQDIPKKAFANHKDAMRWISHYL